MLKEGFGCDSKILADLQKAVKEGRRMSIVYDLYSEGGVKEYTIDPCQLYFKRRALYVDAYVPDGTPGSFGVRSWTMYMLLSESNSGDGIQQLTSSLRQMQTLARFVV